MSTWVNELPLMMQARRQLQLVSQWQRASDSGGSLLKQSAVGRVFRWLLSWLWRLAILVALLISFVIELLVQLLGPIIEFIEAILGWLLLLPAAPLELFFSIPYLGRVFGWGWRLALSLIWGIPHLLEAPLVLLGVMPERRVRIWVCLTFDEGSLSREVIDQWEQSIELSSRILRRQANIRLVSVNPLQWRYGLAAGTFERAALHWFRIGSTVEGSKPPAVSCNRQALLEDLGPIGGKFDRQALLGHPRGAFRRITGWGAPIMALMVDSVDGGRLAGCSLGPLTDYLTVRVDKPVCLAHELAHSCNLFHHEDGANLMNPTCGGVHLQRWQVLLLRLSRHATLF